jgi:DNA-binding GntR family transcriptional regulator
MIVTGEIAPGEKLKIEALKTRLEAGTAPIREALSLLTSDQLVERIDQRGFRAAPSSKAQFHEILKLRCVLDVMALRQSIANATPEWQEDLVLRLHRLTRAKRDEGGDAFENRHKAFHMALLANCGSPILLKLCDQLYDLNIRYRYLAGEAIDYGARDIAAEHAEMMAAILDHDADRAATSLVAHYQATGRFLARMRSKSTRSKSP